MNNPAETLYRPEWDSMERAKALEIAARQLQAMYGPESRKPNGSPLDCVAHIYRKHGHIEEKIT